LPKLIQKYAATAGARAPCRYAHRQGLPLSLRRHLIAFAVSIKFIGLYIRLYILSHIIAAKGAE
jgi:hypothetical protein